MFEAGGQQGSSLSLWQQVVINHHSEEELEPAGERGATADNFLDVLLAGGESGVRAGAGGREELLQPEFQGFGNILLDWQLALGIGSEASGAEFFDPMIRYLGLDVPGGVSSDQYQLMALGIGAPGPRLLRLLTDRYQDSIRENPDLYPLSPRQFLSRGMYLYQRAQMRGVDADSGMELQIVTISDELSQQDSVADQPYTAGAIEPILSGEGCRYVNRRSTETAQDRAFKQLLETGLTLFSERHGTDVATTRERLAGVLGINELTLDGIMPLPQGKTAASIARELAGALFPSLSEPAFTGRFGAALHAHQKEDFQAAAQRFLTGIEGMDLSLLRDQGIQVGFGEMLQALMEFHRIDAEGMASALARSGHSTSSNAVRSWALGNQVPRKPVAELIGDLFGLPELQTSTWLRAYRFSRAGLRLQRTCRSVFREPPESSRAACTQIGAALKHTEEFSGAELAFHLGLYPASLAGFASGELVPSDQIFERIARFGGLNAGDREQLAALRTGALAEFDSDQDRQVSAALGATTTDIHINGILENLIGGDSPISIEQLVTLTGISKPTLEAHQRNDVPSFAPNSLTRLCTGIGVDSAGPCSELLHQANDPIRHIPVSIYLEESMHRGQTLQQFIGCLTDETQEPVFSISEISRQTGLAHATLNMALEGGTLQVGKAIDRIADRLQLSPHGRCLWYQMVKGDRSAPTLEAVIKGGQQRLAGGDPADQVAEEVYDLLVKRSGFTDQQVRAVVREESESGNLLHGKKSFHEDPPSADRIAGVFAPLSTNTARQVGNLLLGLEREESPSALLARVESGEITVGRLIECIRLQHRDRLQDAADCIGVDSTTVQRWERNIGRVHFGAHLENLTNYVGFEDTREVRSFRRHARWRGNSSEDVTAVGELLNYGRAGELALKDFVAAVRTQEGLSKAELGEHLGIAGSQVGSWEDGFYVREEEVARRFGIYLEFDGGDLEDFVLYARGRYVRPEDGLDTAQMMSQIRAGELSLWGVVERVSEARKVTQDELRSDIGIGSTSTFDNWKRRPASRKYATSFADNLELTGDDHTYFVQFASGTLVDESDKKSGQDFLAEIRAGTIEWGELILQWYTQEVMTQGEFAEARGVHSATVSKWRNGKSAGRQEAKQLAADLGLVAPDDVKDFVSFACGVEKDEVSITTDRKEYAPTIATSAEDVAEILGEARAMLEKEEDPVVVSRDVTLRLFTLSGLTWVELNHQLMGAKRINNGTLVDQMRGGTVDLTTTPQIERVQQIADLLAPEEFRRDIGNILLGIAHDWTPGQLLEQLKAGEIEVKDLLRTRRMLKRKTVKDMAADYGVRQGMAQKWENGQGISAGHAETVGGVLGYRGSALAEFAERARGQRPSKPDPVSALTAEQVQSALSSGRERLRKEEDAAVVALDTAKTLCGQSGLSWHWIGKLSGARGSVDSIRDGSTDLPGHRTPDFIDKLTGVLVPFDSELSQELGNLLLAIPEEKSTADFAADVMAGRMSRCDMIRTIRLLQRQTIRAFARDIGVEPSTAQHWEIGSGLSDESAELFIQNIDVVGVNAQALKRVLVSEQ